MSVFCINVRAVFDQPFDHFQIIALDGRMQGRISMSVFCINVRAVFDQYLNHFQRSVSNSVM